MTKAVRSIFLYGYFLTLLILLNDIITHSTLFHSLYAEMRFNQLLDDQDHKRCKEGNKKALLAEKLERLRALKDEIAKDSWKFDR